MSVAGPVVPHHPAWGAAAAAAGGSDGDDDDPSKHPGRRLKSAHEADLVPIRGPGRLTFACEPCLLLLAFETQESVKAHHGNRSDVFLTMRIDPRYDQILVETFTLAQAAAVVVRAARQQRGPDA